VFCSGRCLLGAYAHVQLGHARKLITEQSNLYLLRRAGRKTIRIPFDRKTLGKVRLALRRRERVVATIFGATVDPSGNVERQTRGQQLRLQH
jgi:hypothetical protein